MTKTDLKELTELSERPRTDAEIVAQTNEVARIILRAMGYEVPEDLKFYERPHPHHNVRSARAWDLACEIMELITQTEANEALRNLEEEAVLSQPETAGWQPIETAPRDGRSILVYDPVTDSVERVHWTRGHDNLKNEPWERWQTLGYDEVSGPTHWMPLPPPPRTNQD